jgi:beta-fructofuranosidase
VTGRPALHFTPERGWINDPHGVTFRDGRYHLFHQAVPDSTEWRPGISWGHVTSPDLLTWQQEPPALVPGDGDDGCWSGSVCTTPPDAEPAMYYTSVTVANIDHGTVRIARPVDGSWSAWRKGPVVVPTPDQPAVTVFRDPNVFWDDDCWRMLVCAGYPDGRAAVLCYRSTDQEHWTPEGALVESGPPESYGARYLAWECPQLVRVRDRHVLLVSVQADGQGQDALAAVGSYTAGRMDVELWSPLTYGPGHYAPTTFLDADGQPCVLFWIRGIGDPDAGWNGALSIPYRLSVVDGRLALAPHPVLASARPGPGRALGLTWRPDQGGGATLALPLDDGTTAVDLMVADRTLTVRTRAASVEAPVAGDAVHVVVDGPVLEVATGSAVVGLPMGTTEGVRPPALPVHLWWH